MKLFKLFSLILIVVGSLFCVLPTHASALPYTYTGQEEDVGGLMYYGARYYDTD